MKKIILTLGLILTAEICSAGHIIPTDIDNGWSPDSNISKIYSGTTATLFKLTASQNLGCGHPDMWRLPIDPSETSKIKTSLLLAAFATGKTVRLRCEDSKVTDFEILN